MDWGLDPYLPGFADKLASKMQTAGHIHFDISGMKYLNGPNGILTIGGVKEGSTNWELLTIWRNSALMDKTTFYRNGKIISPADILKLH